MTWKECQRAARSERKKQIFFFLDESLKTNKKEVQLKVMEQSSVLMHVKGIVRA